MCFELLGGGVGSLVSGSVLLDDFFALASAQFVTVLTSVVCVCICRAQWSPASCGPGFGCDYLPPPPRGPVAPASRGSGPSCLSIWFPGPSGPKTILVWDPASCVCGRWAAWPPASCGPGIGCAYLLPRGPVAPSQSWTRRRLCSFLFPVPIGTPDYSWSWFRHSVVVFVHSVARPVVVVGSAVAICSAPGPSQSWSWLRLC